MATLHHLAPELLTFILRALDSPRDLYALITASLPCLRIFTSNRSQVLSSVLKNAIQPEALRHAVAICHVPPPASLRNPRKVMQREMGIPSSALVSFLDQYFSAKPHQFPMDIAGLTTLCRVQTSVSRFMGEYVLRAAHLLAAPQDSRQPFAPLSQSERARLERAFFRFELFSQIFIREPGDYLINSIFDSRDQLRLFLHRLEHWEVEEMSCVHDFFTVQVGGVLDELEEKAVSAVLNAEGARRVGGVRPSAPVPSKWRVGGVVPHGGLLGDPFMSLSDGTTAQTENNAVAVRGAQDTPDNRENGTKKSTPFHNLGLFGMPHFEECNHHRMPAFISNMASFGLEHLKRLLDGDDSQRNDMIRENAPFSRDFFPEVLRYSPSIPHPVLPGALYGSPTAFDTGNSQKDEEQVDKEPCCHNVGYQLFRSQNRSIYDRSNGLVYNPLREMGYVFWDARRIGIPTIKKSLEEARDVSRETIESMSRLRRKSVEERLRGVELPWSEFRKICDKFGGVS